MTAKPEPRPQNTLRAFGAKARRNNNHRPHQQARGPRLAHGVSGVKALQQRAFAENLLLWLGVVSMLGFVVSYVAVASGHLGSKGYLAWTVASLVGYLSSLLIIRRSQRSTANAWHVVIAENWAHRVHSQSANTQL